MPDVLIVADSIRSPEMRHEVPVAIPDPFVYAESAGARRVVTSSFEIPRIEELGAGLETHPYEQFGWDELLLSGLKSYEVEREIVLRACREFGVARASVPETFPLETADYLRANGIEVASDPELFIERRRVKNAFELEGIRRAQRAAEAGMTAARELLRAAERRNGSLVVHGEPLTCERVKLAVEQQFTAHGAAAEEFIVSHGA